MRILAYEHFSAVGLTAPRTLRQEGGAMLAALALDLAAAGHQVTAPVAEQGAFRGLRQLRRAGVRVVEPVSGAACEPPAAPALGGLLDGANAVWVVAPETGGVLESLSRSVLSAGRRLLSSAPEAVALAASKLETARRLGEAGVPAVPCAELPEGGFGSEVEGWGFPLVVKPDDGVGCEGVGLARSGPELEAARRRAAAVGSRVLVQPYVEGVHASVSVLASPRAVLPLALQGQDVRVGSRFRYRGGLVPLDHPARQAALEVARAACEAVPGLAGLVGVDLVLAGAGPLVVEINPRLTTSYLGLRRSCDGNLPALVLRALDGAPVTAPALVRRASFTVLGAPGAVVSATGASVGRNGRRVSQRTGDGGALGPGDRAEAGGGTYPAVYRPEGAGSAQVAGVRAPAPAGPPGFDGPRRRANAWIGWDLGGANLKAVAIGRDGTVRVLERPFEVWRAPEALAGEIAELDSALGRAPLHAVTMTAELADCFTTKRDGVRAVVDAVEHALGRVRISVFGHCGFLSPDEARARPLEAAAANWLAAGSWLAREVGGAGLLLDVGSTTADLVPFAGGRVLARGRSDPERLLEGELVYTGALRTPLCAVLPTAPLRGRECPVAAEHFAIAADAHLWLGSLEPGGYTCPTPDGGPATRKGAAARLARMVCADREMLADADVTSIARRAALLQVEALARALDRMLERIDGESRRVWIAGSGAFLAEAAAHRCSAAVESLAAMLGEPARALPAYAVARLLLEARPAAAGAGPGLWRA